MRSMRKRLSVVVLAISLLAALGIASSASAASLPPIKHVFIIVLENESASTTFVARVPRSVSVADPDLAGRVRAQQLRDRAQQSR